MIKKIYFSLSLLITTQAFAQIPEEALRLSWITQQGTARNQAIGGAMGSLGGDPTASIVNPAGLAFYKTSEIVLTPGFQMLKSRNNFRGTLENNPNSNQFALGTSGIVFGGTGHKANNSFAITVTRRADFNRKLSYNGLNDYSSFAEPLADEFAASGLTIDEALNSPNISLQTKMALYTYLVDTATIDGSPTVIARSENTSLLQQEHLSGISGGITEITFAMGHEINKKFMIGGSLGIPIINIDRDTYYRETDASGEAGNEFNYLAYRENYTLKGAGMNFRIGAIYRPKEYIRIGLALHSPDLLLTTETFNSGFAADLENFGSPSYDSVSAGVFTGGSNSLRYSLYTPGRIILSGSYVFREVENVQRQKGFISADIEYVNYKWMRFAPPGEQNSSTKEYYEPYNDAIDAIHRGAFNFRVGGELKFNILMARLGFGWYGSPYKESELKASRINLSGGLGYRHKGIFVDLTYVHRIEKDVHFPYRVNAPRNNTFAALKQTGANVLLTFGFKI